MSTAPRPTTILPDGSPLYPAEWSPRPVDKSGDKPARARFPGGGQGAVGGKPQSVRYQPKSSPKPTEEGRLDRLVEWADGFPQAPPPRAPESAKQAELPVIPPPDVAVSRCPPRNVGQYSTPPLGVKTIPAESEAASKSDAENGAQTDSEIAQRRLRFERLEGSQKILPGTPMATCMRYARDSIQGVQIVSYDGVSGYRGWEHCGSRLCPWDASKLAQQDAEQAEKFMRGWVKRKSYFALVHLTFRHSRDETARGTWEAHTAVLGSLHNGAPWKRFKEKYGLLEHILGNEVTIGDNGTHKHQHRVWELEAREQLKTAKGRRAFGKRMQVAYEELYMRALAKHGRDALPGIALKLSIAASTNNNAGKAASYVTKFAKETMQGGLKSGSRGNHTAFELVDIAGDKALPDTVRATARGQFQDLYWGLKGKHWTYFSEATAKETEEGGEEEVPEVVLDEDGDVEMQISALAAAMLANQHLQVWFLELRDSQGNYAAAAWLHDFTDPTHWSVEFLARFRQGPMVHWP